MKIIFDSEEQKGKFLETVSGLLCPDEVGLTDGSCFDDTIGTCMQCLMNAIEMEVKEDV